VQILYTTEVEDFWLDRAEQGVMRKRKNVGIGEYVFNLDVQLDLLQKKKVNST
jgi:hypothetical protein